MSTAKVSASAYATSLCGALGPFDTEITASSKALNDIGKVTPAKGKTVLVKFLSGMESDSTTAVDKLRSAGIPTVSGGAAFSREILGTFTKLQTTLSRSEKVAQQLSTASAATFDTGAHQLATGVKEAVGDIGAGLDTTANKALDAAAAKVAACHGI